MIDKNTRKKTWSLGRCAGLVRLGRPRARQRTGARRLLADSARLVAEQQLESAVLLELANHYANEVHGVGAEEDGRRLVRMLARGYALRVVEESLGLARPAPLGLTAAMAAAGMVARHAPAVAVARAVDPVAGPPGFGPAEGLPAPAPLGPHGWRRAAESFSDGEPGVRGDLSHALSYGYLVRCAEVALATGDGGSLLAPDAPMLASLDTLLHTVDSLLASGDGMFSGAEARVALVLGVLHGLGLEAAAEAARDTAVASARAGYAFRRAEEEHGLAGSGTAGRPAPADGLPAWDALQIAAWEIAVDALPGHPERGAALADLADSAGQHVGALLTGLPIADALRAVRFGYALRAVEGGGAS